MTVRDHATPTEPDAQARAILQLRKATRGPRWRFGLGLRGASSRTLIWRYVSHGMKGGTGAFEL